ncbi:MAG: hypothetical protein DRN06_02250 [Thermoprotei archaeon]|nr:MAG: hypothetical protein DRN06_02250 [Thermoprotei archaeon]
MKFLIPNLQPYSGMTKRRDIKALLFDFDNTLFYSFESYFVALNRSLAQQGLPELSRDEFVKLVRISESNVSLRKSLPAFLRPLVGEVDVEKIERVVEGYKKIFPEVDINLTFAPSSNIQALCFLSSKFKVAIVSARPDSRGIELLLRKFKLDECVDTIITAKDAPSIKPSRAQLLMAAQRLNVEPKGCVMVGDSPRDMEAGRKAYMKTIGVTSGVWSREELRKAGADMVVNELADVVKAVTSLIEPY